MARMNSTFPRHFLITALLTAALLLSLALTASATAAPANDNLSGAQMVGTVPAALPATNVRATAETGEPDHHYSVSRSVWFSWTAGFTGTGVIDVCDVEIPNGAQHSVNIALYTGTNYANLSAPLAQGSGCLRRVAVTSGINYKIAVDFRSDEGNFTFRLRKLTPPNNDGFALSTVLGSALPQAAPGTTSDAGWEAGEPAMGGQDNSRSVWYRWTPGSNMRVRIDVCDFKARGGTQSILLGLYTGNSLANLSEIATASKLCTMDVNVTGGTQYRIAFSGRSRGEGPFTLKIRQIELPANDNFANATPVGPALPIELSGDNDYATAQNGEPRHGGDGFDPFHTVWYSWTAPITQTVRVRACSGEYSAHLGLYTGNSLASLTPVGTPPPFGPYCSKELDAVAGTTYRIAVGGSESETGRGPFTLDIHRLSRPANDDLAFATVVGPALPARVSGTTRDATSESEEPGHDDSNRKPSVWYGWTAQESGSISVSICGTSEMATLDVFTGTDYPDLARVAAADTATGSCPGSSGGTVLGMNVKAGQRYLLQVANMFPEIDYDFDLAIVRTSGPGTNPPEVDPPGGKDTVPGFKGAIKSCKKRFAGKGKKAKRKRARCIRKAKLKRAVAKCRSGKKGAARAACLKKARRKYSTPRSNRTAPGPGRVIL